MGKEGGRGGENGGKEVGAVCGRVFCLFRRYALNSKTSPYTKLLFRFNRFSSLTQPFVVCIEHRNLVFDQPHEYS